jgi:hypothetical protein
MTDANRALNEVTALVHERQRYEAWLAALEARRDTTPAHVFDRVRSDYKNRLERVEEQLAAHRNSFVEEQASVLSRLSLLEAEGQMRRDERAELELRLHVGELAPADCDSALTSLDQTLTQLSLERDALTSRLAILRELFGDGSAAPAPSAVPAVPGVPAPPAEAAQPRVATPSFDELAFLKSVVGPTGRTPPPHPAAPAPPPAREPVVVHDDEPLVTARDNSEGAESLLHRPSASSHVVRLEDSESLLAGLAEKQSHPREGDAPLAANVASNTPIKLRPSGPIEQTKSLKCNECGAMNYPTEWYCERCGAELAAL